ncbi:zinc finger protein 32-like [Anabrus simplex]|uniref:zinc finger protein 32-like n=1 Tax=Anabrus simplex TaxID=316456 RepID=UPI0035A29382
MDQEAEIKEEPVWLEDTENASLESFEFLSEMMPLKQETKLEITEPVLTQEKAFELSSDIKNEIFIEQETVDPLVPYLKEGNKVEKFPILNQVPLQSEKLHECTVRKKSFSLSLHVQERLHSKFHERAYQCSVCDKSFLRRANLTIHLRFHSGERPYQCTICKKSFAENGTLKKHILSHAEKRPFGWPNKDKGQGIFMS